MLSALLVLQRGVNQLVTYSGLCGRDCNTPPTWASWIHAWLCVILILPGESYVLPYLQAVLWNVILPTCPVRICWTIMMLLLLVYVSMVTPLISSFRLKAPGLQRWEVLVDAIFIMDVLLILRTGYQDIHHRQVGSLCFTQVIASCQCLVSREDMQAAVLLCCVRNA